MAIGDILQSISVQGIARNVSDLGSCTLSYFRMATPPPLHKANRAWNDPINGDAYGLFWVYDQNVNGVSCDDVTVAQDLQMLAEYNVRCFCLSEMYLDWNRSYVKSDYLARLHKIWRYSATLFLLIEMESSSDYMTGGTLTSTVDKWSLRVFKRESDPSGKGRWSSQTLVGKQNYKLTIIMGYQCVCNTGGENSAWTQEKIFMQDQQSRKSPNS